VARLRVEDWNSTKLLSMTARRFGHRHR